MSSQLRASVILAASRQASSTLSSVGSAQRAIVHRRVTEAVVDPPTRSRGRWLSSRARRTSARSQALPTAPENGADGSAGQKVIKQLPRFFCPAPLPSSPGLQARLDGTEAAHAMKTLRLKEGDLLELFDAEGSLQLARVAALQRSQMSVEAVEPPRMEEFQGVHWVMAAACGSLKGGRSDWLVEKACELGARAFQLLLTERSESMGGKRIQGHLDDSGGREARLERVALAAAKQSLRPHGMAVRKPMRLEELLSEVAAAPVALVATAQGGPILPALRSCADLLEAARREATECLLIVGPEGDFTTEELGSLMAAGAIPVGLGDLRLRTETAAIALLSAARLSAEE